MTKSAIVNTPSEFLPPDLVTWIQPHNTSRSSYTNHNNNNLYQGFIQKNNDTPSYKDYESKQKGTNISRHILMIKFSAINRNESKWDFSAVYR